jgi:ABC-type glycerol-3-phosphate transport system substrate-binding protein
MNKRAISLIAGALVLTVAAGTLTSQVLAETRAQDDIVLTVAMPEWTKDALTEEMLAAFKADHPGVNVVVVSPGDVFYPTPPEYDVDEYLDGFAQLAESADVLLVSNYSLAVEATRAGYVLDLAPLANADPALDPADFFPALWDSYQWDGGLWALPLSGTAQLLEYDPALFDAAGVAYPNSGWTLDDFADAAYKLTVRDADGQAIVPGFFAWQPALMLRALLGSNLYDDSGAPRLDTPEVASLLTAWHQLEAEGVIGMMGQEIAFDPNTDRLPLVMDRSFRLIFGVNDGEPYSGALLPGGTAILDVTALAVSSGTVHPELAYELAKYLTGQPDLISRLGDDTPARRSLLGQITGMPITPEVRALLDEAVTAGLPVAALRHTGYLDRALQAMRSDGLDAEAALQQAEEQAILALDTAADRFGTATVFVATPPPTPVLAEGEIALTFGFSSRVMPLPNRDRWEQAIADFVAADPQVGQIVMDSRYRPANEAAAQLDCFALPWNAVPSLDLSTVLNLDPFLDADPAFDRADVIGGVLAQLERNNQTWALPLVIQPMVLWYNRPQFERMGITPPDDGWTAEQFGDALRALENGDMPVFDPMFTMTNTHLLMLIAAYGGLPFDYRTQPATVNLTDPATVEAIRQVLDFAKAGLIKYDKLDIFFGPGGGGGGGGGGMPDVAIFTDTLADMSFGLMMSRGMGSDNPFGIVSYPYGRSYTPVSYTIGTAYISAQTNYPEACYRWLSTIANDPTLFQGMPARRSLLADPALVAAQGEAAGAFYQTFATLLDDPNVIVFPDMMGGNMELGDTVMNTWLNRAFDRYVLEDADLDAELAEAQIFITAYQDCAADIPAPSTPEQEMAWYTQFLDCAVKADPSLEERLPE